MRKHCTAVAVVVGWNTPTHNPGLYLLVFNLYSCITISVGKLGMAWHGIALHCIAYGIVCFTLRLNNDVLPIRFTGSYIFFSFSLT